jgi:hypothetical protein
MFPLSSVQPLYESRAEVTITYTPSTSDAYEMRAPPVEKSIASLVLRLRWQSAPNDEDSFMRIKYLTHAFQCILARN